MVMEAFYKKRVGVDSKKLQLMDVGIHNPFKNSTHDQFVVGCYPG
jgi:hypothetical protein